MQLIFLATCIALASVSVHAVRRISVPISNSLATDFKCPEECVECCQKGSWFAGSSFKCVLRDAARAAADLVDLVDLDLDLVDLVDWVPKETLQQPLVAGRTCTDSSKKKSNPRWWKTTCNYLEGETKAPEKCSSEIQCCCLEDNNWTEQQCVDSEKALIHRESKRGGQEAFELEGEQDVPNMGECKRTTSKHHPYQIPPPDYENPAYKSATTVLFGCCLELKTVEKTHRWTTSSMTSIGSLPTLQTESHSQTESYQVCARHERLHKCSDDGGITWAGTRSYKRIPSPKAGTCIGDQQSQAPGELRLNGGRRKECPQGTFTGPWCKCQDDCGRSY